MKHNQFSFKLLNGNALSKFCRGEHKITKCYLDKNGNKTYDYKERKIRIEKERSKIEQNVINDLYYVLGWDTSGLKQYCQIEKFIPDFYDSKKDTYFEITEINKFDYHNNEHEFSDILEHPVVPLMNQAIKDQDNNISGNALRIVLDHAKEIIKKKNDKYCDFNKKINLIVYCIGFYFPLYNWNLINKDKFLKDFKKEILKNNELIKFKPENNVFNKIFLVLLYRFGDNQYYHIMIVINYK